jgi:hypothetical protein
VGLDAVVRRRDGASLGAVEDVTSTLSQTFPGLTFALERIGTWRGWRGVYLGADGLSVEFDLGEGPVVREAKVCLYGQTAKIEDYVKKIPDWTVDYAE